MPISDNSMPLNSGMASPRPIHPVNWVLERDTALTPSRARAGGDRIHGEPIDVAIAHFYDTLYSEENVQKPKPDKFMEELARGTVANAEEIDKKIEAKAEHWRLERMPVVDRASGKFLGLISLDDLLKARARHLEEERRRERTLKLRFFLPGGRMAEEKDISANP